MIWNFMVIGAVVLIFIILARRIPSAIEVKHKEKPEITPREITNYGLVAQADDAYEAGDLAKAEKLYIKAAAQDPDNPKPYGRLGEIYLADRNYYDAKEAFQQAVKLEKDDSFFNFNLVLSYFGLKDYFKACQSFQTAIELDPKNKQYQKYFERAQKAREREQKRNKR